MVAFKMKSLIILLYLKGKKKTSYVSKTFEVPILQQKTLNINYLSLLSQYNIKLTKTIKILIIVMQQLN